jgi:phospholipid transport system transporter-binding protein
VITGTATLTTDGATLAITGVLDFDTVVSLQAEGQRWIETTAPSPFTVELAAVQYSTSAGLALLLDWLRVAARCDKVARLQGMPADMQALVRVGGLEPVLPLG